MFVSKPFLLRIAQVGIVLTIIPTLAVGRTRGFSHADNLSCYVDNKRTDGSNIDRFWYCGKQEKGCVGVEEWIRDISRTYMHGQGFTWKNNYGGEGDYYCCNGTTSHWGTWVHADKWIVKEEPVVEKLPGGTCTWYKRYNACGDLDEIKTDKPCTEPTGTCNDGYTSRGGKCVKVCPEGYGYESTSSNNCIKCDGETWRGVVNGECIKCTSDALFSERDGKCIPKSKKLQISTLAHDTCWLCNSSVALESCLRYVTQTGHLDNFNQEMFDSCSMDGVVPVVNTKSSQNNNNNNQSNNNTSSNSNSSNTNGNSSNTGGSSDNSNTSGETTSGSSNNSSNTGSSSGGSSGKSGGGSGGGKKFEEKQFTLQEEKLL